MLMSSTKFQPFKRSGCGDKDNSFYEFLSTPTNRGLTCQIFVNTQGKNREYLVKSYFFYILLVMSFKEKLENWRTSINRAGSGEELYILLLNYKKFINKNWMDDFGDPGNWKSELNQVISKVRKKVDVVEIQNCDDLSSYKDDARQTAHSLNHTLRYHHSLTKE